MNFASLFPPGVVAVSSETDVPEGTLFDAEAALVRSAVAKRVREFSLGRLYAHMALRRLGMDDGPVLAGAHREPRWPPGVVGSITHCDGFCGVAVARAPIRGIGVDAERRGPLPDGVSGLIHTPAERRWLETAATGNAADWAVLCFSAKESAYKCQFPFAGLLLEFTDIEITLGDTPGEFIANIYGPGDMPAELRILRGRYAIGVDHIYTAVIL